MKAEYQGRGTPHWHIAAWILCYGPMKLLQGRTGTSTVFAFVKFLALVFRCEIDVQIGNGRLNYINGYVAKDHDAVGVSLGKLSRRAKLCHGSRRTASCARAARASLRWPFA